MSESDELYEEKLLRRIEASRKLQAEGYTQETCKTCEGTGRLKASSGLLLPCGSCQTRGYNWIAPVTK